MPYDLFTFMTGFDRFCFNSIPSTITQSKQISAFSMLECLCASLISAIMLYGCLYQTQWLIQQAQHAHMRMENRMQILRYLTLLPAYFNQAGRWITSDFPAPAMEVRSSDIVMQDRDIPHTIRTKLLPHQHVLILRGMDACYFDVISIDSLRDLTLNANIAHDTDIHRPWIISDGIHSEIIQLSHRYGKQWHLKQDLQFHYKQKHTYAGPYHQIYLYAGKHEIYGLVLYATDLSSHSTDVLIHDFESLHCFYYTSTGERHLATRSITGHLTHIDVLAVIRSAFQKQTSFWWNGEKKINPDQIYRHALHAVHKLT